MPFALVIIGLVMIVTGAKDTYKEFGQALVSDFTGEGNFTWWIASVGAIGALGYIKPLETFSRTFMALIILSMLISNRGFFAQLNNALASGPVAPESGGTDAQATGVSVANDNNSAARRVLSEFDINNFRAGDNASENFGKVVDVAKMFFI